MDALTLWVWSNQDQVKVAASVIAAVGVVLAVIGVVGICVDRARRVSRQLDELLTAEVPVSDEELLDLADAIGVRS